MRYDVGRMLDIAAAVMGWRPESQFVRTGCCLKKYHLSIICSDFTVFVGAELQAYLFRILLQLSLSSAVSL
jgi:uncharacterized membrane protein AbrB (regulator of aidB expression)